MLTGNLAPDGAVLKPSAASPHLLKHRGRAVVFETIEDYQARIADPNLDVDATCVLVLKNCGPKGYPGMAEVGNMGLPPKVLETGVTDMVRISDARMSGTAYGTVVLHVCPEAAVGGPLALVQNGDMIELDVPARTADASTCPTPSCEQAPRGVEGARAVDEGRLPGPLRQSRAAGEHRRRPRLPGRLPRVNGCMRRVALGSRRVLRSSHVRCSGIQQAPAERPDGNVGPAGLRATRAIAAERCRSSRDATGLQARRGQL